jgi:phosphatidylglycerol lysyltransferase
VAFANLWRAGHEELSVDLMRYLPDGPNGLMDYLFVQTILWGREQGYAWFSLGMAPLAGLQNRSFAPLWNRFGALVFGGGEKFYNFRACIDTRTNSILSGKLATWPCRVA